MNFKNYFLPGTLLLSMLVLGFISPVSAQQVSKKVPSWILMMDDPNVNYFKAIEAFNTYWKNKEKPIEENELFETEGDEERERELRKKHRGKQEPAQIYAFEYKKFKNWVQTMEPFVQSDGSILSMDERVLQWKAQEAQKAHQKQALEKLEKDRLERDKRDKDKKTPPDNNRKQY